MYTTMKNNTLYYAETAALLPASTYTFQVRATNIGGAGPFSAPFNFTTNGKGGCGNEDDIKVFFSTKTTMKSSIQGAIISCVGKGQASVVAEIRKRVGLSLTCAQCWAEEAQCTIRSCMIECIAPKVRHVRIAARKNAFLVA